MGNREWGMGSESPNPFRVPIPNSQFPIPNSQFPRMDILLRGAPGAGKGTQGAILTRRLGVPKFATGDLLRDAVKNGTPLGKQPKAVMESGALVSDDIIMGVVGEE